jgi:hypothetical protein
MIYFAGILGLLLWPIRSRMRVLRWSISLTLITLHLIMKAPVWALIQRIDLTGSSSSYHRYLLVDSLFTHVGDWWLLGTKNYDTWGPDVWDLSNQFVAYAFRGGLATLAAFISLIVIGFKWSGIARERAKGASSQWVAWCIGTALLAHVTAFFGVNYFDQTAVAWYGMLAVIVAIKQSSAVAEYDDRIQYQLFSPRDRYRLPAAGLNSSRPGSSAPPARVKPVNYFHNTKESI